MSTALLPLVFQASRQRAWDQNGSAALYLGWQSGRSLRAGEAVPLRRTDVGDNLLAYTCTRGPNLARRALKHSWLGGVVTAIKARARPACSRGGRPLRGSCGAQGAGASHGAGDGSRRFDTLCLNFNYLIKDFSSAVNSASGPGEACKQYKESIWLEIQRDGPCSGNLRGSGLSSTYADLLN